MKHAPYLLHIILALALLLVGCHSDPRQVELIDRAEAVMDSLPEVALSLLDSVDSHRLLRADNARYALLLTQARDKNYIDTANDSLINIAVSYYAGGNNLHYKMLAHYYHGRILFNACDYARSIVALLKAEKVAVELNDHYWIGRADEQIANIYDVNFHHTEAINYAINSYESLCKSQKQPYINYALLRLSRLYLNNDDYENGIKTAQQVLDSATVYQNTYLRDHALRVLAKSYFGYSDFTSTIETIEQIESNSNLSNDLLCLLGICYYETNDLLGASKIYDKIKSDTTHVSKHLLYKLYHKNNDTSNALTVLESLYNELESHFNTSLSQNFSTAISQFYEHENRLIEENLQRVKYSRLFILTCFALIITILLYFFTVKYRKQQDKLNKYLLVAQELQEIINVKNNSLSSAQEAITNLINTKYNIINNLCITYFENKKSGKAQRKISTEVENLIRELASDKQIEILNQQVDKHLNHIMSDFKRDLPLLKKPDYNLFLYSIIGFSTTAITLLLGEEKTEAVYNRKARLKNKIKQLDPYIQAKYLSYL